VDDICKSDLERAIELKQALIDFVLDAEDELATALETYSAAQLSRLAQSPAQNLMPSEMVVESFLIAGKVGDETPIDRFCQQESQLTERDRQLLKRWHQSFPGLFEVIQIVPNGLELMNWLTAKHYQVQLPQSLKLTPGEIVLTFLSPVAEAQWLGSKAVFLGKLGKPKLAVAIGNFKQCYGHYLYSDAPDLLTEAWRSVERYHQDFIEFFGTDEVTLPGYQWAKQLAAFQDVLTQRQLTAAGIDGSKSLQQLGEEAGLPAEELEAIEQLAIDQKSSETPASKMVAPKIELPPHLKKAEYVTALSDPRWGQTFLSLYSPLKTTLDTPSPQTATLVLQALQDPQITSNIWQRLAQQYPQPLEQALQTGLERPQFCLSELNLLLQEFHKPLEPVLPEIASVPLHLHELFQEALLEVSKDKPKNKVKRKPAAGFQ
jgi:hypothetical protein